MTQPTPTTTATAINEQQQKKEEITMIQNALDYSLSMASSCHMMKCMLSDLVTMCNNNNQHHDNDDEPLQHHISLRKRTRQTDDHNNEDDDGHDAHQVKRSKTVFSSPMRNIDLNVTDDDEEEEETETEEEEYNHQQQQLETSTTTDEDEEDETFEDGEGGVEKSKLDESSPPIATSVLSESVLGSIQSAKIDPRAVIVWESAPFLIRQDILQVTKHPDAVGGKFLKLFKQENEGKEPFILVTKEHLPELKKQQPKLNGHHFSFKGGNTVHALKLFTLDYVLWLQNYLKKH